MTENILALRVIVPVRHHSSLAYREGPPVRISTSFSGLLFDLTIISITFLALLPFQDPIYGRLQQSVQREQSITSSFSQMSVSTESQEYGQQIQNKTFPVQYGNKEVKEVK